MGKTKTIDSLFKRKGDEQESKRHKASTSEPQEHINQQERHGNSEAPLPQSNQSMNSKILKGVGLSCNSSSRLMALQASEFGPEDFISIMPDNVVTNILERLPLQDAVRTGILSRNWRFKWTMLSQLIFDWMFFDYLMIRGENNYGRIISRLLLHLEGPITKFVHSGMDVEDINLWILFMSRKGIKDLTLGNVFGTQAKLPTYLFSCLELKHLKLHNCYLNPPPSFNGFPNLLSLELCQVTFGSSDLGKFFTRFPLLEILSVGYLLSKGSLKLAEIAKLENLKVLSLSLCDLDTKVIISSHSIFELVGSLPKLQELNLGFQDCKLTEDGAKKMTKDGANKRFLTAFPCLSLKALKLSKIDLGNGIMLSFAFEMIKHFPNLRTLEITSIQRDADPIPDVEYNTTALQSVVLTSFEGSENEVGLIKYLLGCSPFLKKIVIYPALCLNPGEQLVFARKLLKLHRASPVVEFQLF